MTRRWWFAPMAAVALLVVPLISAATSPAPVRGGGTVIVAVANRADGAAPRAGSTDALVSVILSLGSDPGTVCFEMRDVNLQEAGQNGVFDVFLSTGPPSQPDFPPPNIVADLGSLVAVSNSVTTGCVGGLTDAVVTDLFTNPSSYHVDIYFKPALDPLIAWELGAWLDFPGARCALDRHPTSSVFPDPRPSTAIPTLYVYPELPVQLWGSGFLTLGSVDVIMAPQGDTSAIRTFTLPVDDFGRIEMVIPPPHGLASGHWFFSAPNTGCEGPAWPAGTAGDSGGGPLPDTAAASQGAPAMWMAIAAMVTAAFALVVWPRLKWHGGAT